jgi:polyglycine hydrolase-like protein
MTRSALRTFSLALAMTFASVVLGDARAGTDDRYAAIWAKVGPAEWVARHGMTSDQYQQEFNKFTGQGMRLVVVDGYEADGVVHYAAIWNKASSPPWEARHGMSSAQYQAEFDKLVGQGFRLVWVNGYTAGGQDRYAAIWEKSGGPQWVARHGLTSAQYQAEFDKHVGEGFRLVLVSGYAVGNEARYAAIWQKDSGPAFVARHGLTGAQYQAEFDKHVGEGFRLALVNGYRVGNQTLYAAIWDKAPSPAWVARHGMTSDGYQQEFNTFTNQGYRLIDVSGY